MSKETHAEAYIRVINEWKREHTCCPECDSEKVNKSYSTSATATFENGEAKFEDKVNYADCGCGWKGMVHELKPKK